MRPAVLKTWWYHSMRWRAGGVSPLIIEAIRGLTPPARQVFYKADASPFSPSPCADQSETIGKVLGGELQERDGLAVRRPGEILLDRAKQLFRLVDVQLILIRKFFVLEELVLLGQEFLERRSFLEANRPLISVRESQQRALIVSAACHELLAVPPGNLVVLGRNVSTFFRVRFRVHGSLANVMPAFHQRNDEKNRRGSE